MQLEAVKSVYEKIIGNMETVVIGRGEAIRLAVIALLSGGHVLLEDVPGSGKTLLAKSLAASVGCEFKRIQFTPDMLPSDITGINYFNMKTSEFEFLAGPIFANIVLADEINRATPKTQAGLLECMEERQVTIDTVTHRLAPPFMVIATQNPIDTQGVFPLPEAQLDRFTFKIPMQYTSHDDTVAILKTHQRESISLSPVVSAEEIINAQSVIPEIFVHQDMMGYIVSLAEATRVHTGVLLGVSARGALVLMRTAQTIAAINNRDYVIPDDVKQAAIPVMAHRLILRGTERVKKTAAEEIVAVICDSTTVPTEFLQS
ncbi:MAG: MoxR family ATPase [Defluviitaleaceae bacterium]|nr:MoxR family ATPase [Defluviitaleaceae bacterium]